MKADAIKIADNVYWVGAIDWNLKEFHGYLTQGTTYNAFLLIDDKVTLIDTVKAEFKDVLLSRISSVIEPSKIDYIISNHSEMDHSGCLPEMIDLIKPEKVIASKDGVKNLCDHFNIEFELTEVANGEDLSIGKKTLQFYETRMIHWPDSMFSYLKEDGILFSNDAFGMHLASSERFDDQLDPALLDYEAAKYYINIINPFSNLVARLLSKLGELKMDIKMITPDHGPVWRKDFAGIIKRYEKWTSPGLTSKALIIYDTMWHSTEKMGRAIGEGLLSAGAKPKLMPLSVFHISDIVTHILGSGALIIGSPTFNSGILPSVAGLLEYCRGLKIRHPLGAAFGSYGWSPISVKRINEAFEQMKIELVHEGVQAKYVPGKAVMDECYDMGAKIGDELLSRLKGN